MSAHLIVITLGGVQEMISAARRTRDLWLGSHVMSEISKAAALAVHQKGGKPIFPAPEREADLQPGSALNVANVILAELPDGDPAAVAEEAIRAARSRWRSFADHVHARYGEAIRRNIWEEQVDDIVEIYAAWHPLEPERYQENRAALMRLLGARKRCRDFLAAKGHAGVPKSSLDGLRESVLLKQRPPEMRQRLRLSDGEQLDVPGMVKRVWAPKDGAPRYPSVARVAADPWLRRLPEDGRRSLIAACRQLGDDVIHELDLAAFPHYRHFPLDAAAVYVSRHPALIKEAGLQSSDLEPLTRTLHDLRKKHGEPAPYLAVLVADGDQMGKALSGLKDAGRHREFSRTLAGFAHKAREIVAGHHGVLVYAGGDDVLALLPCDGALACARALHEEFGTLKDGDGARMSLSAGLALAHCMEPLEDLLAYGRAAERHAKQLRNALAVHVVKRGGSPVEACAHWDEGLDGRLAMLAGQIRSQHISGRMPYELRQMAELYQGWPTQVQESPIQRDVLSVLEGKEPRAGGGMEEVRRLVQERVTDAASLLRLAHELLVARALANVFPGQAEGADTT